MAQAAKISFAVLGILTALAGHSATLPVLLQPFGPYIEAAGFLATIVNSVLITIPRREWTPEERAMAGK
jgi:hypothetical protein